MDFVKKFASEQLEKQLSGNNNENQQQHQQQNQGYGNQQSSNYGGFNEQQQSGGGGYGQQQQGQQGSQFGVTGGPEYNAPHGQGGASSFLGGGGSSGGPQINQAEAMQAANQHAGNGNENASLFSQAFSFVSNMNKDDADIDEDKVQQEHKEAYDKGNAGNMSASAMGSAAALQAIKQFTQGSSNASAPQQEKGGNDMVSKIIGMAISEAAKMFDKSGGAASGDKQDAVNSASQTVMKLLIKNQVSGMIGGGQSSGGLGQLMGMASKFM